MAVGVFAFGIFASFLGGAVVVGASAALFPGAVAEADTGEDARRTYEGPRSFQYHLTLGPEWRATSAEGGWDLLFEYGSDTALGVETQKGVLDPISCLQLAEQRIGRFSESPISLLERGNRFHGGRVWESAVYSWSLSGQEVRSQVAARSDDGRCVVLHGWSLRMSEVADLIDEAMGSFRFP